LVLRAARPEGDRLPAERVEREITITGETIDRVALLVDECGSEDAAALLAEARALYAEALVLFGDGNLRGALEMTMNARRLAMRAAELCRGTTTPDDVLVALERTDEFIASVRPVIEESGVEAAITMLAEADETQATAYTAYEDGDARTAMARTTAARNLARRAEALATR
jgi:hypothetical protein